MTKYGNVSYIYVTVVIVNLRRRCLGIPNCGNVKVSSAERSACLHEAC